MSFTVHFMIHKTSRLIELTGWRWSEMPGWLCCRFPTLDVKTFLQGMFSIKAVRQRQTTHSGLSFYHPVHSHRAACP